jgi:hypothetical protein
MSCLLGLVGQPDGEVAARHADDEQTGVIAELPSFVSVVRRYRQSRALGEAHGELSIVIDCGLDRLVEKAEQCHQDELAVWLIDICGASPCDGDRALDSQLWKARRAEVEPDTGSDAVLNQWATCESIHEGLRLPDVR